MSDYFEIVVFTAAEQQYADDVLNQLDPHGHVTHRLYRQHTVTIVNNITGDKCHVKDLGPLGRDLSKVIIVDNLKENFGWQKDNGIHIRSWTDDTEDVELEPLSEILAKIVTDGTLDVRDALQNLRNYGQIPQISVT